MSGYKTWGDDEVLDAPDLNGYLMAQVVPRFADAAARSAELAAPAAGQLSYLDDLAQLQLYDGTTWLAVVWLPAGGTTGQVLAKASDADFDVTWSTP